MDNHILPHDHGQSRSEVLEHLPGTEELTAVSNMFRLLGDCSRIRIFWILCHCEECVINLSAMVSMSSPAVSHHLKLLKTTGMVVSRRDGKEVYYKASENESAQLLHRMIENVLSLTCPDK